MHYFSPSCDIVFLGILSLGILAHPDGNGNVALNIQQRDQEVNTSDAPTEAPGGVGDPCLMTDDCGPGLCCLHFSNGTTSCQKRPDEDGQTCSPTVLLTPFGDEGPYQDACPCANGYYCYLPDENTLQERNGAHTGEDASVKLGQCKLNGTTTQPTPEQS
ncbi:uncharacterized protein LOC125941496 [Dermacentor silvarum]|uniref:uncharacterized protein LOC125941496 n=1 Tax=Dermacentor silvarum TaxID=543639 RepID=UPI0021012B76|nr:uncharacterized protein LOC125941496 [Dermacentor silvarum]